MGQAYFYHLTERPLEATLPVLLAKALEQGWRVEVRGREREAMDRLDRQLWAVEGFLPHGLDGGPHDADQPVLLTVAPAPDLRSCVISVGGADVAPDEVKGADRVCILFEGADAAAVETARAQWRTLTEAGVQAFYWAEDGGRWIKKAESGT